MSTFEINVSRVAEGSHEYAFAAAGAEIGLSETFPGTVALSVRLERSGRQFLLSGDVACDGMLVCDRCLASFVRRIEGSYTTLYLPPLARPEDLRDADEVRSIPADSQVIELDDDARQALELAVPTKVLCRDDCAGLCPTCGKDLNGGPCNCVTDDTDPRWDALRTLTRTKGD